MNDSTRSGREERVLLFAPAEQALGEVIADAGLECMACTGLSELCRELEYGAGVLVLAEEALGREGREHLDRALLGQPGWSDLPVLLLSAPCGDQAPAAPGVERLGNVTVLERPVRSRALLSTLRSALRARRRQYELRDQLQALEEARSRLRAGEAELRRHLSEFRTLLDVLPVGIFIAEDPHCRIIRGNPAGLEMLGTPPQSNLSKAGPEAQSLPFRVFADDGREVPGDELPMQLAVRTGKPVGGMEVHVVRDDGTRTDLYEYATPLFDEAGRARGCLGVFVDITERKRAEQALRESEARFQAFMNNSPALALIKDQRGRYTYANRAAQEAFQWTGCAWRECSDAELWPPAVAQQLVHNDRAVLDSGIPQQFYESFPTATGERRFLTYKFPFQSPGGETFLGIKAVDVTELERAAQALRESEERYRGIFDQAAIGIARADLRRVLVDVNPGLCRMLGYSAEELVGANVPAMSHPDDERATVEALDALLSGRRSSVAIEKRCRHKDGHYVWTQANMSLTHHPDGSPAYIVAVVQDITERRRAEEALMEANRRKDRFLATLAHELRNPLAPLGNALQVLRLRGDEGPVRERFIAMMERQLHHLVRLVDDLLEVSRISSGKIELRRQAVSLAEVLANAVDTSGPLIEAGGHELRVDLPAQPLVIEADPVRLAQVVANLLNNAAKYTAPGGRILLRAARDGDEVVIAVRDTGAGIPPQLLPEVFEMFFQSHPALSRQGGLGIGLSLVKNLVQLHGGRVEARSQGEGQGSEFIVRLPAAAPGTPPADAGGARRQEAPGAPLKVLVVDDNRDSAESIGTLLQLLGHDVCLAHAGPDALDAAARLHPDVALLDIGMPGMDGYQLARRLRSDPACAGTLLVAMTGYGQPEDRRRSRSAGFDEHLVKPVDANALKALLARRAAPCHPPTHRA